jgi:hypothetical protein
MAFREKEYFFYRILHFPRVVNSDPGRIDYIHFKEAFKLLKYLLHSVHS